MRKWAWHWLMLREIAVASTAMLRTEKQLLSNAPQLSLEACRRISQTRRWRPPLSWCNNDDVSVAQFADIIRTPDYVPHMDLTAASCAASQWPAESLHRRHTTTINYRWQVMLLSTCQAKAIPHISTVTVYTTPQYRFANYRTATGCHFSIAFIYQKPRKLKAIKCTVYQRLHTFTQWVALVIGKSFSSVDPNRFRVITYNEHK